MRKLLRNFLAGNKVSPQDLPEENVERPKKPRGPHFRETGEPVSWGQWEYLIELPCWNFWEKKKLEILRAHYPEGVTSDTIRKESGMDVLVTLSSFASINDKMRSALKLPYLIKGKDLGFQLCVVAPIPPRDQ